MEFKVGDRVRIKSWEQMEKEFGKDYFESINCIPRFIEDMKHLCGKTATIDEICNYDIKLKDWSGDSDGPYWFFSMDMIELVDTSKFTKSDLQEGDIVTDREGCKSLFHNGALRGRTLSIYGLTDDLKDKEGESDNDIVKVERPIKLETVFERKEPEVIEMTMTELCEHFGCKVKIVKEKE